MILKLGMKHLGMVLYKVYINHDPGMTLTYFMACNGRKLDRNEQMGRRFMLMKIF